MLDFIRSDPFFLFLQGTEVSASSLSPSLVNMHVQRIETFWFIAGHLHCRSIKTARQD